MHGLTRKMSMRNLYSIEAWCDYCDKQNGKLTGMKLATREEYDPKAGVLYPRYIDVCVRCEPEMVDMGYVAIRPISREHPSAGRRRPVNRLRVVRSQDET